MSAFLLTRLVKQTNNIYDRAGTLGMYAELGQNITLVWSNANSMQDGWAREHMYATELRRRPQSSEKEVDSFLYTMLQTYATLVYIVHESKLLRHMYISQYKANLWQLLFLSQGPGQQAPYFWPGATYLPFSLSQSYLIQQHYDFRELCPPGSVSGNQNHACLLACHLRWHQGG